MSNCVKIASLKCRKSFQFGSKELTHYFPGHMNKGINQIQRRLKDVDCVIEVHDARPIHIPFSGRNPFFQDRVIAAKPHVLLFSKADLADLSQQSFIENFYRQNGVSRVLFANCAKQIDKVIKKQGLSSFLNFGLLLVAGIQYTHVQSHAKSTGDLTPPWYMLIPTVSELIEASQRYGRIEEQSYNVMVIGIPNVGKSSLINSMRRTHLGRGKATPVGAISGVTRSVLGKIWVCANPPIFVLDTPGIMMPKVQDPNVGMKLALCANLKDHLVGEYMMADYLLFWLNTHNRFEYVQRFELPGPTDDISQVLFVIAKQNGFVRKVKPIARTSSELKWAPNFDQAAGVMIRAFRNGELGAINLDETVIQELQTAHESENQALKWALRQRANESVR